MHTGQRRPARLVLTFRSMTVRSLARRESGRGSVTELRGVLLRSLLLLLTDADFEHLVFGFLESLMIVPGDGVFEVRVDIGILRQDGHESVIFATGRAKGPKALYIRDCHRPLE